MLHVSSPIHCPNPSTDCPEVNTIMSKIGVEGKSDIMSLEKAHSEAIIGTQNQSKKKDGNHWINPCSVLSDWGGVRFFL